MTLSEKMEGIMNKIEILRNAINDLDVSNKSELLDVIKNIELNLKNKKYGLVWEDRVENVKEELKCQFVSLKENTEKAILNKDVEGTNILIEGDNLESLMALQYTHKNSFDVIAVDPPYNAGGDFVYNDTRINKDDKWRHSAWLSFMSKRLELAKELLKEDGIITLNIDGNECAQLKLLCDEIFGESNFVTKFVWVNNARGRSTDKFIAGTYEEVLMYAKNIKELKVSMELEVDENKLKKYKFKDEYSLYKKGDALFNNNSIFNIETRPNLTYSIYVNKKTNEYICVDEKTEVDGVVVLPEENLMGDDYIKVIPPIRSTNGKRGCWRWSMEKFNREAKRELMFEYNTKGVPMFYSKNRLDESNQKWNKYKNIITDIPGSSGTKQLVSIMNNKVFDHPKPTTLIKRLIGLHPNKNALVLDFFAGSGTTGHAVLELNKEDGGNRRFVLCTNNENNICEEVTYERLNRVINGYVSKEGKDVHGIPANLRYYKVDKVEKTNNYDLDQFNLLDKSKELIQIKEGAFEVQEGNEYYSIFTNNNKAVSVYSYSYLCSEELDNMINSLLSVNQEEKVAYVPVEDISEIYDYLSESQANNIRFKKLPKELIDIYNKVNRK